MVFPPLMFTNGSRYRSTGGPHPGCMPVAGSLVQHLRNWRHFFGRSWWGSGCDVEGCWTNGDTWDWLVVTGTWILFSHIFPNSDDDAIWLSYFSEGLKPPTRGLFSWWFIDIDGINMGCIPAQGGLEHVFFVSFSWGESSQLTKTFC